MRFHCAQCGVCCHPPGPFSVYEWERTRLQDYARKKGIILDIRPECAYRKGNRLVVLWYRWYIHGTCPFLLSDNGCSIHAHKSLMCARYPYPDFGKSNNWRCVREKQAKLKPSRKSRFVNPVKMLPPTMAYSALFLRFFEEDQHLVNQCFDGIVRFSLDNVPRPLQVKDFFSEMTRTGVIPPQFLEIMNHLDFSSEKTLASEYAKLSEQIPKIAITQQNLDTIFDRWGESSYYTMN